MATKKQQLLQKVIEEIIDTEKKYYDGLTKISKIGGMLEKMVDSKDMVLRENKILLIFQKIAPIKGVSEHLLDKLKTYSEQPEDKRKISDVFQTFPAMITVYIDYIPFYHETMPYMRMERQFNPTFEEWASKTEKMVKDTIDAFLITPVQRPPRYQLLLKECSKNMEDEEEKNKIGQILEKIVEKINNVDTSISSFQEAKDLAMLQNCMPDFNFFEEGVVRKLFFYGPIVKFSRKKQQPRFIILLSDQLIVAEPSLLAGTYKIIKQFKTRHYGIRGFDDFKIYVHAADIMHAEKSFRINLPEFKFKKQLLEGFYAMLEYNNIKKEEIDFDEMAPIWVPNELESHCYLCDYVFPKLLGGRHHCRRCGHNVCKDHWNKEIKTKRNETIKVCPNCYKDHVQKLQHHKSTGSGLIPGISPNSSGMIPNDPDTQNADPVTGDEE